MDPRLGSLGRRPLQKLVVREASTRLTAPAAVRQGLLPRPDMSALLAAECAGVSNLELLE